MDEGHVILLTTGTSNGFDELGHFLRSYLPSPDANCLPYAVAQSIACSATFNQTAAAASTTTTPPGDATTATVDGSASLVDERAPASTDAPPATAPAGTGVLNYLLGGSGER